ncbi:DUF5701 family protein [Actinomadura macrotermitis]|uniref:Uncharacterized protein n=1 Tax=Actinomadura macrotermitis TaxID=2585200 RepID=A0A7K0BZM7_9ACTN|nr:DUF5701 family protein [Actinomadura macrotermitis]MQY06621.1 hypothetical protein [Actinomadura macrotermitis]
MTSTPFDAGTEFDRQIAVLRDRDYPEPPADLAASLRRAAVAHAGAMAAPAEGRAPFTLVVTRELVPIEEMVPRLRLANGRKAGVIDRHYKAGELVDFVPAKGVELPDARAYLLLDADRGEEFCGAIPNEAMAVLAERGRTLLTIEEGIALVTQHPELLAKNKCFSLGGSRCGDRRVPALWISERAPKLGWCWEGNPHTWLGMAHAAARIA